MQNHSLRVLSPQLQCHETLKCELFQFDAQLYFSALISHLAVASHGDGIGAGAIIGMCSLQSAAPQVHSSVLVRSLLPSGPTSEIRPCPQGALPSLPYLKMLHELPPPHREDCVNSLAHEADARVQDPVYRCVGSISVLQQQVLP